MADFLACIYSQVDQKHQKAFSFFSFANREPLRHHNPEQLLCQTSVRIQLHLCTAAVPGPFEAGREAGGCW